MIYKTKQLFRNWNEWKEKYSKMHYTGGKRCWGAGDREAEVILECGVENKIISVDEPSTCVYSLVFETPAACSLEYAKSLREDYDMVDVDIDSQGNVKSSGWFY